MRGGPALFVDGACDGKRVTTSQTLALPMGDVGSTLQDIFIHAGISNHFGLVTIVKPFLLRAPAAVAAPSPEPAFPPSLPPLTGSSIEEGGLQLDPSLPLDLPPSLPRLPKAVLLDPEIEMVLSWAVGEGEGEEWVDIQVGRERGKGRREGGSGHFLGVGGDGGGRVPEDEGEGGKEGGREGGRKEG